MLPTSYPRGSDLKYNCRALALALALTAAAAAAPSAPDRSSWGKIAALVVPAPANAYLHVANAQQGCAVQMTVYADGWFANNGYGHTYARSWGPWSHRVSDSGVIVHSIFLGSANHGQAEVRCYMTGSDDNMGVAFVSGYPMWTYLGREDYPYVPCGPRPGYPSATIVGGYCMHDQGFN
jgi:hypothetical protein